MAALHEDEIPVDLDLVRRLVDSAFPEHAGLALRALEASGSSNALFRLGDDLLVRLPRQPGGSATITKESRWLPLVAPRLSVDVPRVLAVGEPDFGYPERWAITQWIEGRTPRVGEPGSSTRGLAEDLAAVVTELRALDVPPQAQQDASLSSYRGGPLVAVDADFRQALSACRSLSGLDVDLDRAVQLWERLLAATADDDLPTCWYHGDLLAENLLVHDDRLVAVLDFGGLAVGDPAVDLICAWELFAAPERARFREVVGTDDASWRRAAGWALFVAVVTFPYYWRSMPDRCAHRRTMLRTLLASNI